MPLSNQSSAHHTTGQNERGIDPPSAEQATKAPNHPLRVPEGVLWGAATAAHQVEGGNRNNDWWAWEKAGRAADESGDACGHYSRFKEDFAILSDLQHNAPHKFECSPHL